jgi:hypothetical protein
MTRLQAAQLRDIRSIFSWRRVSLSSNLTRLALALNSLIIFTK